MHHIDELTLMMYVDKELDAEERDQIELHLSLCCHCRNIYSQLLSDQTLLLESFVHKVEANPPVHLNPFTQVQIEAIASLHKKHQASLSRSYGGWVFAGITAVLTYYLFISPYVSDWMSSKLSAWQYNFLWTSAFWLKENIGEFLAVPKANLVEISLFFLLLVSVLLFLNYRRASLRQWNRSEGGIEK